MRLTSSSVQTEVSFAINHKYTPLTTSKISRSFPQVTVMHLSMVCPTWHTLGRCWRKKGNLALESSPRGWYIVGIVKMSREQLGLDDHCHK